MSKYIMIMGIKIRIDCGVDCTVMYLPSSGMCSVCKYFKLIDVPKLFNDLIPIKQEIEEQRQNIFEVVVKDNKIINVLINK